LKFFFRLFQKPLEIYTDGSLKNGRGAWAYVISRNGKVLSEASGRSKNTTSNRMEFQAAVEALKTLPPKTKVILYSDSKVLITTINLWMAEWKNFGWEKKDGRPIPHSDLVKALDELCSEHEISWKWIKAHSGIPLNERCDELCIRARG